MKLMKTHHFCIRKALLSHYFIIHIAELLLIHKLYCFCLAPNISFKSAEHNHARSLMIGDVSSET